jgi:hypothetical protein
MCDLFIARGWDSVHLEIGISRLDFWLMFRLASPILQGILGFQLVLLDYQYI